MKEFNTKKFCEDLLLLRGNESQFNFANKIGVNRSTLSLLETGKQLPSLEILSKICKAGGYDLNSYFQDSNNDALIFLMGSLEEPDKEKISELMERIKIKEKYEYLYRRSINDID